MKYVDVVWLSFIVWEIRNYFIGCLLAREGQAGDYPSSSTVQAKYCEQPSASPRIDLVRGTD